MALINLTLMLLLTCFIGKSNLLFVSVEPKHGDNYLSNNKQSTDKSIETNLSGSLTQNKLKDDQINHISGSGLVLEQQYRNPKFTLESINPKDQVEDLQSDDIVESDFMLEEQFRNSKYSIEVQNEMFDEDIEVNSMHVNNSHDVIIFAIILAILSVATVFAFVSWRAYIKKQFGRSHRLVPSDELYFNDDRVNL